jgi:hypothetical protein
MQILPPVFFVIIHSEKHFAAMRTARSSLRNDAIPGPRGGAAARRAAASNFSKRLYPRQAHDIKLEIDVVSQG